jgi:dihydroneopterin aldolase
MTHQDIIRIKNAVFYAYHGVVQDEQNLGGKFEVDAELFCDLSEAEEHDSLKQTVDYEKVYSFLKNLVLGKKYYLIEALGNTIANGILSEFPRVSKVLIRVRKPSPPVKGVVDYVEAEVERTRR